MGKSLSLMKLLKWARSSSANTFGPLSALKKIEYELSEEANDLRPDIGKTS
jgi:hypothetical protein